MLHFHRLTERMIRMIKVRFYTTVCDNDRFVMSKTFLTMEEAIAAVDEWEAETYDNYAIYTTA